MGRNFIILTSLFCATLLYGAYYWGVPAIVDMPNRVELIQDAVYKNSGYKISITNPDLKTGLIPSLWLSADNFAVLNDDNSKALEIKAPSIKIRLLPLLWQEVDIHHISADYINADFVLDKDKKFKLGQYEIQTMPESKLKFHTNFIDIGVYNLSIKNEILNKKTDFIAKTHINPETNKQMTAEVLVKDKNSVLITAAFNSIANGLEISGLKVAGDNINANVSGKITNINSKLPNLDLNILLKNSKAENILALVPDIPDLSPDINVLLLKQTGFWGNANANLKIKGKADYPNIDGNVTITDAYMVNPIPNAKKATIKLDFKGDKFDLDVEVPTSPNQTVWVKGPINLDKERSADLNITSTSNVDLKTAQIVLNPLHEILHFDIGPVPVMDIQGNGGINLHVIGTRKNPHGWGQFYFKNVTASFLDIHNMVLKNGSGTLDFNDQDTLFQTKSANLNGKPISVKGTCSLLGVLNFDVVSNAQDLNKLLLTVKTSPMLADIQKLIAPIENVYGNADVKINLTGQVKDINDVVFNKNIFAKGSIKLLSNTLKLKNLPAAISKTSGTINFNNLDAELDLNSQLNSSRLAIIGKIKENHCDAKIISERFNLSDAIKLLAVDIPYKNDLSSINTSFMARYNGKIDYIDLDKVTLKGKIYSNKGSKSSIIIDDSAFEMKNSTFKLPRINAKLGEMLLYIDGKITNIQKTPFVNVYINAKPTQEFVDKFFNNKSLYPIKIKGDTILTTRLTGPVNSINAKSTFNIASDSSLYYMGASIGDNENPVKLTLDNTFLPNNRIKINNLQYDKIIKSQNNRPVINTQLNANGTLKLLSNNNIEFSNFRIKTKTPTDAKIFNIIFRKPFMKQGVFTSDLVLNGTSLNPKIFGKLNITSIDIPFFDSTIRDVNLDFKNNKIYITSKGTVLTNDINIFAIMQNKFTPPYVMEDLKLQLNDLDINKITDTIRDMEIESTRSPSYSSISNPQIFDLSEFVINKAEINADKIKVRNINADNFKSTLSLNDKMLLNVDNFKFDIAQGSVIGNLKHNLLNRQTNLNVRLNSANAQVMSEALFDLKGQVYGLVDGDFSLSCNGSSTENCFRTLSGNGNFNIKDGKMPKLGSLEYLLKAGNLIKGGITGLSLNSIIDLVTPLKTGNFESISGNINIKNGTADNIKIYSSGDDLNMYMTGSYNIVTSVADMEIFGSLSKNITTVFGKIKNASLNTMFNTIPGINNSNEKLLMQEEVAKIPNINKATDIYRVFAAEIYGNINEENFVKSFRWVK